MNPEVAVSRRAQLSAPVEETTLSVHGNFDLAAAMRLKEAVAALPQSTHVTLDFSHLRQCQDLALAALVHGLRTLGRTQVATRGLSEHHHRVLRYLGSSSLELG